MNAIVCGGRNWLEMADCENDEVCGYTMMACLLRGIHEYYGVTVIEGGARGADASASRWAEHTAVCSEGGPQHSQFPADWENNGRAAGPIRNQPMLDEGEPHVVLVFKDDFDTSLSSGGSEDMVRRAKASGVPVFLLQRV